MPRRVISLFSVEFFSRILPIKLGRESLFVSESLGHRRILCSVAGYRDSPLILLASQTWKFSCLTPSNFRKYSGIDFSMHENGKSRSSFEILCLTVRKNFLGTTSKIQKVWGLGNFFVYHGFSSIFLSHSTENLRGEPSKVSKSFKREVSKRNWIRTEYHDFPSKIFRLRVHNDFVVEHLGISKKFGYRKISCPGGWYHFSPLNFFHVYFL